MGEPDEKPAASNPQTCCSNCHTVFEVPENLLASSDTRVRCGECLSIFDALINLRDQDEADERLRERDADLSRLDGPESSEDDQAVDENGEYVDSQTLDELSATRNEDSPARIADVHVVSDTSESIEGANSSPSDAEAASVAGLANDTAALDVTYSDFDLFSEDADLPEVAYFDQTRDTPDFDFDSIELGDDETFNDTLFAHDVTIDARQGLLESEQASDADSLASGLGRDVDFATDEGNRTPIIFTYREPEDSIGADGDLPATMLDADESGLDSERSTDIDADESPSTDDSEGGASESLPISLPADKKSPWLFRSMMFLLLCAIAGGLYIARQRDTLHNNPIARPVLVAACAVFKCDVRQRVDLTALRVLQRSVYSHPSIDNALVINVAFRNEAAFDQQYPVLVIRLSDRNGRLVAKRDFQPADYLEQWHRNDTLDAGKRLDISLEVNDPGDSARSFELDFREVKIAVR